MRYLTTSRMQFKATKLIGMFCFRGFYLKREGMHEATGTNLKCCRASQVFQLEEHVEIFENKLHFLG